MIQKACYIALATMLIVASSPAVNGSLSDDLVKSMIEVVNETTRYQALNPNKDLKVLTKVKQIKGNYKFTIGNRIDGE